MYSVWQVPDKIDNASLADILTSQIAKAFEEMGIGQANATMSSHLKIEKLSYENK